MDRPLIRLKTRSLEEIQRQRRINESELALLIGISATQLWRIKAGRSKVGSEAIAGLLAAFPAKRFEDFFELR